VVFTGLTIFAAWPSGLTDTMQKGSQTSSRDLYTVTVAGVFIIALIGLWSFPKTEFFRIVNPVHNDFLDGFFKTITYLGDGWVSIIVGLVLLLTGKKPLGSMVLAGFALSGLLSQLLKSFVSMPRPRAIIPDSAYPHFIADYTLNAWNSFPSGHTASVFSLTALLAWNSSIPPRKFTLAVAAILTGYSRIYLGQHFPDDVLSGALLGLFSAYGIMILNDRFELRNKTARHG
jgi:membrane-associated phospholipid phosphatase